MTRKLKIILLCACLAVLHSGGRLRPGLRRWWRPRRWRWRRIPGRWWRRLRAEEGIPGRWRAIAAATVVVVCVPAGCSRVAAPPHSARPIASVPRASSAASTAHGSRSGSHTTQRGTTINYGAAGAGVKGPGGGAAGKAVGGVQVTTPGGRTATEVGRADAVVGPYGNADGGPIECRGRIGSQGNRGGGIAECDRRRPRWGGPAGERGVAGVGQSGSFRAGERGVAGVGQGGAFAAGERGVAGVGPGGGIRRRWTWRGGSGAWGSVPALGNAGRWSRPGRGRSPPRASASPRPGPTGTTPSALSCGLGPRLLEWSWRVGVEQSFLGCLGALASPRGWPGACRPGAGGRLSTTWVTARTPTPDYDAPVAVAGQPMEVASYDLIHSRSTRRPRPPPPPKRRRPLLPRPRSTPREMPSSRVTMHRL